jgi:hypothetical protein
MLATYIVVMLLKIGEGYLRGHKFFDILNL